MGADVAAVAWKEWREILRPAPGSRMDALRVPVFVAAGIFFAWRLGPGFGSAWTTLVPGALVAALGVLPVVADSFAGERERHSLETLLATRVPDAAVVLGKVLAPVAFGWGLALVSLAGGLAVHLLRGGSAPPLRAGVVAAAAVASLLLAALVAAAGVLVSLGAATVKEAQQRLSLSLMMAGFLPPLVARVAPPAWTERGVELLARLTPGGAVAVGLGILAAVDATLLLLALARFRRSRVVLD